MTEVKNRWRSYNNFILLLLVVALTHLAAAAWRDMQKEWGDTGMICFRDSYYVLPDFQKLTDKLLDKSVNMADNLTVETKTLTEG